MSRRLIQCIGKEPFASAVLAMRVASRSRKRHKGTPRPPRAYRCDLCGRWHIGGTDHRRGYA